MLLHVRVIFGSQIQDIYYTIIQKQLNCVCIPPPPNNYCSSSQDLDAEISSRRVFTEKMLW